MTVRILQGDCRDVLPALPDGSIHSIVTDPPYGLGFMGKAWDHSVPGVEFWREMLRVAKPGAHLLAFGGTRTFHRIVCAIEDAGWEIRDQVMWLYGSGFPKSKNLHDEWEGWGTALKPAHEPIIVARKPLIGTVAANVLAYGTGALNIDGCRIDGKITTNPRVHNTKGYGSRGLQQGETGKGAESSGRWAANVCHDGSEEVLAAFPDAPGQQRVVGPEHGAKASVNTFGDYGPRETFSPRVDSGSAARFFYCAKASRKDRNAGCEGIEPAKVHGPSGDGRCWDIPGSKSTPRANNHPTVKPTDLMRWLVRLVTPPGGTVLDPFAGSGSTGRAADIEGFDAILIELNPEYVAIARRRIAGDAPLFAEAATA